MRRSLRPAAPPEPLPAAEAGREELLADLRVEVESALLRGGASLPDLDVQEKEGVLWFRVRGEYLAGPVVEELARRLQRLSSELGLQPLPEEKQIRILRQDKLQLVLLFLPPEKPRPLARRPRLAIVMDDLGRDLKTARALLEIDLPVTFAILPWEPEATRVAALAHSRGREVLLHMPMEPKSYPRTDPGPNPLLLELSPQQIRERLQEYLLRVPHAVGGNNHMGSRFTENRQAMAVVLEVLRENNFFFLDSLTSAASVGAEEAQRQGVPAVVRDLFLDNDQDTERIAQEIRRLAVLAGRKGEAVGICHPYPETLEALRREAPRLKEMGIEVVPVSRLVKPVSGDR